VGMKHDSVLLDTSFFIRLLNDEDPLHENAKGYYKYFLEKEIVLKVSTISIAEYCVGGELDDLPLRNIQIIPFNLNQAKKTGEFARIIFDENKTLKEKIIPRAIIPNDAKLFSQADSDETITHFVTSDIRSIKTLNALKKRTNPRFEIMEISTPFHQRFGLLDL
jgi:predicted nucleic acid-binding protein